MLPAMETVWLTRRQLAQARGITLASARTLTKRQPWPRAYDGHGTAVIGVPAAYAGDWQAARAGLIREPLTPAEAVQRLAFPQKGHPLREPGKGHLPQRGHPLRWLGKVPV